MQPTQEFLEKIVFILASLFSLVLITSIFFGVYFLGDTISHFQYAALGGPLTTFIQHDGLWPPLLALVLNIVVKIPGNTYLYSSILVATILVMYLGFSTIFCKLFLQNWKTSFSVAALSIIGPVTLIMQSLLSEPLFMVLWITSLFFLSQFWISRKEKWLIGWVMSASLLPLTRYLGIISVGWMLVVLLFTFLSDLKNRKKTNYSRWLMTICFGLVWIPLAFYLLRTKIQIGTFLPIRDAQTSNTLEVVGNFLVTIATDLIVIVPVSFILGVSLQSKKKIKHILFFTALLLGAGVTYLVALLVSQINYFVLPYVPSRYVAVSYPLLVIGLVCLGVWFGQKYLQNKSTLWKNTALILVATLFIVSSFTSIKRLQKEVADANSHVDQVAWTGDVQKFCDSDRKKYLVAHLHSRNWLAWSYAYLCNGISVLQNSTTIEKDAVVISAYDLESYTLVKDNEVVVNNYTTRFYVSTASAQLNIERIFETRQKFE